VASTGSSTTTDSGTLIVLGDPSPSTEPTYQFRLGANWLIIILVFAICLLLLIVIISTICSRKLAQKKLLDSQEQFISGKGKESASFQRMISKTSYGKVSMHPNDSKNTSSSASIIDPLEQPLEDFVEPQDQIDEMKWDHEISFRFQPGNLSMFGQNFNFEHDRPEALSPLFPKNQQV